MSKDFSLRIATRKSPLALWQAEHVAEQVARHHPGTKTELIPLSTTGDSLLDSTLVEHGGKGLFLKELETALVSGQADIAVHSMKDVPVNIDQQFVISSIGGRAAAQDVLISRVPLNQLAKDAVIGTASSRRRALLGHLYKRFSVDAVRGNVQTRLRKFDENQIDALVLAKAGLDRLGLSNRIQSEFPKESFIPAVGQGVLAVEYVADRNDLKEVLEPLIEKHVEKACCAERSVALQLGATCAMPVGIHCSFNANEFDLRAIVLDEAGDHAISARCVDADIKEASDRVATQLMKSGADRLLNSA